MDNRTQFWSGIVLLVVSAAVLFAAIFMSADYSAVALIAVVIGLAIGSVLVGLSRRGRAV